MIVTIPIESLHQPTLDSRRGKLDEDRILYYMNHPEEITGVLVYENPTNGERITVNGHHRVESACRMGRTHIEADLQPGTRTDALRYWDPVHLPWSEIEKGASLDS